MDVSNADSRKYQVFKFIVDYAEVVEEFEIETSQFTLKMFFSWNNYGEGINFE